MKIAFVSQPFDRILPPYQNSVGACTHGIARPLANKAKVLVYGIAHNHQDQSALDTDKNIEFRFFPATRMDKIRFKLHNEFSKFRFRPAPISSSGWLFPDYGRSVAEDLREHACDVIHLQHCSQYAPLIRQLNPEAKIVLHLHAEWFSQSNLDLLADRLHVIDLVTTVGNYVTDKTKRAFPVIARRCETTYNGIDAEEFSREKDYAASRKSPVKRILYSGAISPHKGLHVLLQAFVTVAKEFPSVILEIAGPVGNYPIEETFDMQDREMIRAMAPYYEISFGSALWSRLRGRSAGKERYLRHLKASLPEDVAERVIFLGMIPRPELVERYYAADIFAFPPVWNEGFGLPPVEAMAAGVPVVTSRSGTVTETVVDGKTGYLVEKNNAKELAEALLTLLNNEERREAMGRAGRERALSRFTWENIAEDMRSRYQTLCASA
ncbi:MAG TPA: glycosyltransferase family 4 protein [Acidobacteriaceae bacterium]|nr:glycosyltransferase family 4 protein [Acidobacteriaceae bacterium]